MNLVNCILLTVCGVLTFWSCACEHYEPNWHSIESRPLPDWFDKAKVGIFLHWGVFSVPSFGNEWFWEFWTGARAQAKYGQFMKKNFKPNFTYEEFAPMFTAEFFEPNKWASLFSKSGAKYVVLTSKHHEGFTLWPSKYSYGWNAMDVGPKRDLVGDLAKAIRVENLKFGLYHSLFEWFNPMYLSDKKNDFHTDEFVRFKARPEMEELVNLYKPSIIWSDGDWEAPDSYWNSTDFLAWLYNQSPVKDEVVVNDRWGKGCHCKHGGFLNCKDRYNPGSLQTRKWENAMTIDRHSWGYRREAHLDEYKTTEQLIATLAQTVSCGGNILINVGPTKDGTIIPLFEERLLQLGEWLKLNGEAIYESKPWKHQNDTITKDVWYTHRAEYVYAIVLNYPANGQVHLGAIDSSVHIKSVHLLGYDGQVKWDKSSANQTVVHFPPLNPTLPIKFAYVFRFELIN